MCAIKIDVFGTTHVDFNRLWSTGSLMTVFAKDVKWHRLLESTRLRDRVSLWQNPNAQWDELISTGRLTKWTKTHS